MDALFVFFIAVGFFMLIVFHRVTSSSSITTLGIGYFLAAIFGIYYVSDVYNFNWKSIKNSFIETWHYSRWALVGVTSAIFQTRAYIYIVSASLGLEKIAEISAARLSLMPIGFFVASSGRIILAKGAEIINIKGVSRFNKFILTISCFLIFVWISYVFGLWSFIDYLISFIGDKYSNIKVFALLWGIFFLIHSLRYPVTNALSVCKEFKSLAKYDVISAIITIATCLILTKTLEGHGAIISLIVGELAMLLLATSRLKLFLNRTK
jgi:O-antigen/teichoic acid export membrane protein